MPIFHCIVLWWILPSNKKLVTVVTYVLQVLIARALLCVRRYSYLPSG